MFKFNECLEAPGVIEYLKMRGIYSQYLKAKKYLLNGHYQQIDFKKRKPKSDEVFYFRINKQFRAIGYIDASAFIVTFIDNHQ